MNFHPDPPKQAQESIFPRKYSETSHSVLLFNSNHIQESSLRKHLGIILDSNYIKDILQLYPLKCIRPQGYTLNSRKPYQGNHYLEFINLSLDIINGDIIFDQSYNALFYQELETFQYNTILAIAEVIHATSKEKLSINQTQNRNKINLGTENYHVCRKSSLTRILVIYST